MSHNNNQEPQPRIEEPNSEDDEKENALIVSKVDKTSQIWQQNHEISKKLERLVTVMTLIDSFKSTASPLARVLADEVQKNSKELIATQAALRQCMQTVLKVESYKSMSMNNEQKETWRLIETFRKEIRKAVINVNDVTAEWFGYLTLLRHGLVFFYESMANGIGTPANSISEFQSAAKQFSNFYEKNASKFHAVRDRSEEAMQQILDRFNGRTAMDNALKARKQFAKLHEKQSQKLKELKQEKWKAITRKTQQIAVLEGEFAQHDVQLKFEKQEIFNLEKEQRQAAYRARKNEETAETKTNYKREKRTTNIFGWKIWGYYKDVHTGEHDRYKRIANDYRNMRDNTIDKKAVKTKIIKLATQRKTEIQRKIENEKAVLDDIRAHYDEKIKHMQSEINQAKKDYDDAEVEIQNAIKKYSVNRHSISDFLQSTNALSQESLKALEVTKKVEVAIRTFSQIVKSRCRTVLQIDYYFECDGVNLERMIEPLKDNYIVNVRDLECDDEKDFNERILPHVKEIANKHEIYKLKKLSCDKKGIATWKKREQELADSNVANLMKEVPPLAVFFPSLTDRLRLACKMLSFKDATDNIETLKMIQIETDEFNKSDEKNRKINTLQIKEVKEKKKKRRKKRRKKKQYSSSSEDESTSEEESSEDTKISKKNKNKNRAKKYHKNRKKKYSSDSDNSEMDSDDSDKGKRKNITKEVLLLKELVGKNKAKCLDGEYDTVKIPFNKDDWYKTLRKLLRKGEDKGVDVKLEVSTYKCKYTITDAYLDKDKNEKNQEKNCVLTLEEIDGNTAKCMNSDWNTAEVKFDENQWGKQLKELWHEKAETEEVYLEVSGKKNKYTIIKVYKE